MDVNTKYNIGDEVYVCDFFDYNDSPYATTTVKGVYITRDIISEITFIKDDKGNINVCYRTEKCRPHQYFKEEFVFQNASKLAQIITENV